MHLRAPTHQSATLYVRFLSCCVPLHACARILLRLRHDRLLTKPYLQHSRTSCPFHLTFTLVLPKLCSGNSVAHSLYTVNAKRGRSSAGCISYRAGLQGAQTSLEYWTYGASELRFPHEKCFLRKLSAVWASAFKNVLQPSPRPKG